MEETFQSVTDEFRRRYLRGSMDYTSMNEQIFRGEEAIDGIITLLDKLFDVTKEGNDLLFTYKKRFPIAQVRNCAAILKTFNPKVVANRKREAFSIKINRKSAWESVLLEELDHLSKKQNGHISLKDKAASNVEALERIENEKARGKNFTPADFTLLKEFFSVDMIKTNKGIRLHATAKKRLKRETDVLAALTIINDYFTAVATSDDGTDLILKPRGIAAEYIALLKDPLKVPMDEADALMYYDKNGLIEELKDLPNDVAKKLAELPKPDLNEKAEITSLDIEVLKSAFTITEIKGTTEEANIIISIPNHPQHPLVDALKTIPKDWVIAASGKAWFLKVPNNRIRDFRTEEKHPSALTEKDAAIISKTGLTLTPEKNVFRIPYKASPAELYYLRHFGKIETTEEEIGLKLTVQNSWILDEIRSIALEAGGWFSPVNPLDDPDRSYLNAMALTEEDTNGSFYYTIKENAPKEDESKLKKTGKWLESKNCYVVNGFNRPDIRNWLNAKEARQPEEPLLKQLSHPDRQRTNAETLKDGIDALSAYFYVEPLKNNTFRFTPRTDGAYAKSPKEEERYLIADGNLVLHDPAAENIRIKREQLLSYYGYGYQENETGSMVITLSHPDRDREKVIDIARGSAKTILTKMQNQMIAALTENIDGINRFKIGVTASERRMALEENKEIVAAFDRGMDEETVLKLRTKTLGITEENGEEKIIFRLSMTELRTLPSSIQGLILSAPEAHDPKQAPQRYAVEKKRLAGLPGTEEIIKIAKDRGKIVPLKDRPMTKEEYERSITFLARSMEGVSFYHRPSPVRPFDFSAEKEIETRVAVPATASTVEQEFEQETRSLSA